jgi:hypothetical protein
LSFFADPSGTPKSFEELISYIKQEFERISVALRDLQIGGLQEYFSEPPKKKELMMVIADGVGWNPTQEGRGIYIWAGGQWNLVKALPAQLDLPVVPLEDTSPESTTPTPPFGGGTLPTVVSLLPSPTTFDELTTTQLTVAISAVQASDTVVSLSNLNPAIVSIPTNVTVPTGQTTATFNVQGLTPGTAQVVAGLNGTSVTATLNVTDVIVQPPGEPLPPELGRAIPTFHSVGLYWTPGAANAPGAAGVYVQYRVKDTGSWIDGHNLWFDPRNSEARGSIVYLDPDTAYEFRMGIDGINWLASAQTRTWDEDFADPARIKETKVSSGTLTQPLVISVGGSPDQYVKYKADPSCTIDVSNNFQYCIEVRAPYVIIEGFKLTGAQRDGIRAFATAIAPNVSETARKPNIIIQNCEITNWGTKDTLTSSKIPWESCVMGNSAIYLGSHMGDLSGVVVQFCEIHTPRYGSSPWDIGHPQGPNGIFMEECGKNNVYRYNKFWQKDAGGNQDTGHTKFFMDALGGGENDSLTLGYPGPDSDIYGNYIHGCMDDGIEAEGSGRNVRVWNNYIDMVAIGTASTGVAEGPIYFFRNVLDQTRHFWITRTWDNDDGWTFGKYARFSGIWSQDPRGRRYVYHNTTLQRPPSGNAGSSSTDPERNLTQYRGCGECMAGLSTDNRVLENTVSRNNILQNKKTTWNCIVTYGGTNNDFDYELYQGNLPTTGVGTHMLSGTPTYVDGHGPGGTLGLYQLASGSGLNDGVALNNFNDGASAPGGAPDRGAAEAGCQAFVYGPTGSGNGKQVI